MKENQNFGMTAGDYKEITVPVTDSAGANLVITGASIEWVVKKNENDATPLLTCTTTGGKITILTTPNDYKFKITLLTADTTNIEQGVYYHEAKVMLGGNTETVMRGRIRIKKRRTS